MLHKGVFWFVTVLLPLSKCQVIYLPSYFDIVSLSNNEAQWLKVQNIALEDAFYSHMIREIRNNSNVTINPLLDQCLVDLDFWRLNIKSKWARKVLDSLGKPHSGLYTGNIMWLGDKLECENIHVTGNLTGLLTNFTHADFRGKYGIAVVNPQQQSSHVAVPGATLFGKLLWGFCTAESCADFVSNSNISRLIHEILHIPAEDNPVTVFYPTKLETLDTPAIIAVFVMFIIGCLCMVGTLLDIGGIYQDYSIIVDVRKAPVVNRRESDLTPIVEDNEDEDHHNEVYKEPRRNNLAVELLVCFSVVRNARKILSVKRTSTDVGCLHGIRFLSMAWVILGHTYYFGFTNTANPVNLLDFDNHGFCFQAILQAIYSVDTFFLLSGFLLGYHFFRVVGKQPERLESVKFWICFYLNRIWRLTPTYAVLLCAYVGLLKYVGNGPLWPKYGFETDQCQNTWWTNLLYVNNLVEIYSNSSDGQQNLQYCAGWTWFLAADMQFFMISPLILYPLIKGTFSQVNLGSSSSPSKLSPIVWTLIGWILTSILVVGSMLITGFITSANNLPPNMFPPDLTHVGDKFRLLYIKPWGRIIPFLVGVLAGHPDVLHRSKTIMARSPLVCNLFGWLVSTSLCGVVLFGLWPQYRGTVYSVQMAALYAAGSRLAWALAITWVILACASGRAKLVDRFLSWKLFVPLSRLTYCAYLIHPMIMYAFYYSLPQPIYYSDANMTWYFAGFLLYSYIGAFIISTLFESPFMAIGKIMFATSKD